MKTPEITHGVFITVLGLIHDKYEVFNVKMSIECWDYAYNQFEK